jgi:hypothetical protein
LSFPLSTALKIALVRLFIINWIISFSDALPFDWEDGDLFDFKGLLDTFGLLVLDDAN